MNLDNISKVECTGDAIPSACIILTMTDMDQGSTATEAAEGSTRGRGPQSDYCVRSRETSLRGVIWNPPGFLWEIRCFFSLCTDWSM